jgi:protein TonB
MAENQSPFYVDQLDEIVFSKRNKEYGAYALRKAYKKFVNRSLIGATVIMLAVVLIPFFIWKQSASANQETTISTEMLNMADNKAEDAPPPPPPPPEQVMEQKAKFTAPVITSDTTEVIEINQDDLSQTANTTVSTEEVVIEDDGGDNIIEEVIETPIFTVVEEMPTFPGGDESRVKFLTENIKYPQMAKESGIQGTVFVTFVIDEKGRVADVKVLRGIGGGCDEEAIRVVKMMPPWNAGKQSGKPVRVQFNMPIKFTLN